jgi:hypothetical protein
VISIKPQDRAASIRRLSFAHLLDRETFQCSRSGEKLLKILDVNALAPIRLTRAFRPSLIRARGGGVSWAPAGRGWVLALMDPRAADALPQPAAFGSFEGGNFGNRSKAEPSGR